jgi:hypothetical protein
MTKTFTERTGQDRLLDMIREAKALQNGMVAMTSQQAAVIFGRFAKELTAANTEIAAEMAELINAKPGHCCACGLEHGPKYIYSGICDSCYEDRIA